jgi:hypothetical protein
MSIATHAPRTHARTPRAHAPQWTPIYRSQLTAGGATSGRAPLVTMEQFQQHAARGAAIMNTAQVLATPSTGLDRHWNDILRDAYVASRNEWGGATYSARYGVRVADDLDAYALTIREPGQDEMKIPATAGYAAFAEIMNAARTRYARILTWDKAHLGVFHDAESGMIDIDPVYITPSLADANDVGAFTHATGGAYHFASGDGYWAPSVADPAPALV